MRPISRRSFIDLVLGAAGAGSLAAVAGCAQQAAQGPSSRSEVSPSTAGEPVASQGAAAQFTGNRIMSFVVMSDLHLSYDPDRDHRDHYAQALADIASFGERPDTIVLLGDITDNALPEQYGLAREVTEAAGFDFDRECALVMGNHDQLSDDFKPEEAGTGAQYRLFMDEAGTDKVYYDFELAGQHFICLGPDENQTGNWVLFNFSDEQVSWLASLLDEDERLNRPSFVFCHEPLRNTVRGSMSDTWGHYNSLEDDDELKAVVAKHGNVLFFSGHTHAYLDIARPDAAGPLYVNDGAIATGQLTPDTADFATGFVGAFGWLVTVFEDRIELEARDFLKREWIDDLRYVHVIS